MIRDFDGLGEIRRDFVLPECTAARHGREYVNFSARDSRKFTAEQLRLYLSSVDLFGPGEAFHHARDTFFWPATASLPLREGSAVPWPTYFQNFMPDATGIDIITRRRGPPGIGAAGGDFSSLIGSIVTSADDATGAGHDGRDSRTTRAALITSLTRLSLASALSATHGTCLIPFAFASIGGLASSAFYISAA